MTAEDMRDLIDDILKNNTPEDVGTFSVCLVGDFIGLWPAAEREKVLADFRQQICDYMAPSGRA